MDQIQSILNSNPFVQGGLTLMVAGWLGYQLRAMPTRVIAFVRSRQTRVIEVRECSPLYNAWLTMLTEGAVRRGGPRTIEVRTVSEDDEDRAAGAGFAAGTDDFWARACGKWCRVSVRREPPAGAPRGFAERFIIELEVFRASRADLERMLAEAKRRANVAVDRQLVDLYDKWGSASTVALPKRSSATLCLPSGLFEDAVSRIRKFLGAREQYELVGVPWRYGVLLHGQPGTGKTSLSHALASELGLRLAVVPLADLKSDEELFSTFSEIRDGSIVLLEDVDCAFEGRKSEDVEGITFAGFLNCIDGVLAPHNGRILMMSTNHPEKLDAALTRPGRVDHRIELGPLTRQAASDYVDRVFPHVGLRHEIVDEVMAGENPTPAILINRIMRENWRRDVASSDVVSVVC